MIPVSITSVFFLRINPILLGSTSLGSRSHALFFVATPITMALIGLPFLSYWILPLTLFNPSPTIVTLGSLKRLFLFIYPTLFNDKNDFRNISLSYYRQFFLY